MREIKFRGYNGEKWLFGNLDIDYKTKQAAISDDRWWRHPVRFETVGQFTGLLDSAGKEIYEGDIISIQGAFGADATVVKWHDGMWCVKKDLPLCHTIAIASVIGNVYDNPELLKGGD